VSENNPAYSSVEGVLFSKDCTELIAYPNAKSNICILPISVTSIGDYAFEDCTGLTSVTIGNGVKSIGNYAFYGCTGLASITIPNSVTSIGFNAFDHCTGLVSITIPYSVTSIEGSAFAFCTKLKEFIVSENNSAYSSVEGVLFSKDCTKLIAYPYAKSNIYTLPNSVTSIGDYAFYNCTGLTSVTIGNGVISIGDYVFFGCKRINEIHCRILMPQNVDSSVFYAINKATCKLYIPKGTYSNYLGAIGWRDFTNIIEEEEATAVSQTEKSNVKVYIDQDAITVTGADLGDNISVYTESGALLQTTKVTDNTIRITVPCNKIYLIKTAGKVFKVAL